VNADSHATNAIRQTETDQTFFGIVNLTTAKREGEEEGEEEV
jgi:hypothetical protein